MDTAELKRLALQSTKLQLDTAEIVRDQSGSYSECPMCCGGGTVDCENEFVNIDGVALGVQFYGIGNEFGYAEQYFRAVTPDAILELLEQRDALLEALEELLYGTFPDGVDDDGSGRIGFSDVCVKRYNKANAAIKQARGEA